MGGITKKKQRLWYPKINNYVPSYSVRAELDFGFCSVSVGIFLDQLATARLRAAEVLPRNLRCHFRGPAVVPRVSGELEAVGLPGERLPRGDPLDKWLDAAQGGAEDSRRKLGIAPHGYPNIVIWRGGVSRLGCPGFENAFLRVTSEVFATVIMLSSLSMVIRHTLYWMSVISEARCYVWRWVLT